MGAYIYYMFPFLLYTNMGDKTYTYNGELYDFNELSSYLDSGFGRYISNLSGGDKNRDELYNAYANMMEGIGDGSITFLNGRFNDSRGRYSNGVYYNSKGEKKTSKDKNNDYYGLVANYIAKGMQRFHRYKNATVEKNDEKPTLQIKKKYNSTDTSRALLRNIFNTDTKPNIGYFLDLDPYDTTTGARSTTNRLSVIKQAIILAINDDFYNQYPDMSLALRDSIARNVSEALTRLDDGIDDSDYYYLSKAFPEIPWDELLTTKQYLPQLIQQSTLLGSQLSTLAPLASLLNSAQIEAEFGEWLKENAPTYTGDTSWQSLNDDNSSKYGLNTVDTLNKGLSNMDSETLSDILSKSLFKSDYKFSLNPNITKLYQNRDLHFSNNYGITSILNTLKNRGELILFDNNQPGVYYVPLLNIDKTKGSVFIWNSINNTIRRVSMDSIPFFQNKLMEAFIKSKQGGNNTWYSGAFTLKKKEGGIIKAQVGTKLWYEGLLLKGDYDVSKYNANYNTSRLINADFGSGNDSPWVSNLAGLGTGRYKPTEGNTREYTRGIEATLYYLDFGNDLLDASGNFTDVGLAWAKLVDALLPKNSKASFFDENGKLRTSWTTTNNDVYGRSAKTFNNLADYVNHVRNDQILGGRHNVFGKEGVRYFYKDSEGNLHWVDPEDVKNYTVSENPVATSTVNGITWSDYELTGLVNPEETVEDKPAEDTTTDKTGTSGGSNIHGTEGEEVNEFTSRSRWANLWPDLMGVGRLALSIRTNNKVAKTLKDATKPYLLDTYELYSPVTGAFSEMQFRNRQAADLRRLASRAYTSDASLLLAGLLDANRQARELEYQGFLADDKEIKRTKEEALERLEDNMRRRSAVANENRKQINLTNRERALIEAQRLKSNWGSVDNYLQEVESRTRSRIAENNARRENTSMQVAQDKYQEALKEWDREYMKLHPDATEDSKLNDATYVSKVEELRRRYNYDMYNIGEGRYYKNPYTNTPKSYYNIIYDKLGGKLKPSTMYLINKVIKDESNT